MHENTVTNLSCESSLLNIGTVPVQFKEQKLKELNDQHPTPITTKDRQRQTPGGFEGVYYIRYMSHHSMSSTKMWHLENPSNYPDHVMFIHVHVMFIMFF